MYRTSQLVLNYYLPNEDRVIKTTVTPSLEDDWYVAWLDTMVHMNEEVIFFYTVPTTEIF